MYLQLSTYVVLCCYFLSSLYWRCIIIVYLFIICIICFCGSSIIEKVCLCWSVLTLYFMCESLIIALGTNYFQAERKCFFHFLRECDTHTHTHCRGQAQACLCTVYTHWNCDFKETGERERKNFLVVFFFCLLCCPITVFACGFAVMVWLREYLINVLVALRSIWKENRVILNNEKKKRNLCRLNITPSH